MVVRGLAALVEEASSAIGRPHSLADPSQGADAIGRPHTLAEPLLQSTGRTPVL